jgi:hypothetical protein
MADTDFVEINNWHAQVFEVTRMPAFFARLHSETGIRVRKVKRSLFEQYWHASNDLARPCVDSCFQYRKVN